MRDIDNLNSINALFNNVYNELMKFSDQDSHIVDQMSNEEKHFFYTWNEDRLSSEFEVLPESTSTPINIKYIKATAHLEYAKKRKKDSHGHFLPKNERLNFIDIDCLFFESNTKVFVLILSPNSYHINRTKKLIGLNRIHNANEHYSIDPNLFTWLFYNYTSCNGNLSRDIKLENINGFVGNVTDDTNVFTGDSYQTTELIVTKAFISNGGHFRSVHIRVKDQNADLTVVLDDLSSIVLNIRSSSKLILLENTDKTIFLLLYLYGYLLLKLKLLFNTQSVTFNQETSRAFSKTIGMNVLASIIEKNNISLTEIESIFPINNQTGS